MPRKISRLSIHFTDDSNPLSICTKTLAHKLPVNIENYSQSSEIHKRRTALEEKTLKRHEQYL